MNAAYPSIGFPYSRKAAFVLVAGLVAVFATISAHAQTFTQIYDFQGGTDGGDPVVA